MQDLLTRIRTIPDFPKPGILFYDITTLLKEPDAFRQVIDGLAAPFAAAGVQAVVAIESRGFIFGGALAVKLGAGFIPVRKPGKLPAATARVDYELEYGQESLEIHQDAVRPGLRVLVVDDLLATGGTALATTQLVRRFGGVVAGVALVIELAQLGGRERLADCEVVSLIRV